MLKAKPTVRFKWIYSTKKRLYWVFLFFSCRNLGPTFGPPGCGTYSSSWTLHQNKVSAVCIHYILHAGVLCDVLLCPASTYSCTVSFVPRWSDAVINWNNTEPILWSAIESGIITLNSERPPSKFPKRTYFVADQKECTETIIIYFDYINLKSNVWGHPSSWFQYIVCTGAMQVHFKYNFTTGTWRLYPCKRFVKPTFGAGCVF